MATINNIKNLISCGADGVLGTGVKGCRPFLSKVASIWLVPSGFAFDSSRNLDVEYIREVQAAGNLIVLGGVRAFTDESQDNVTEELEDGTVSITRLGLYQFNANFINGLYFNAALNSISGFSNYDTLFVDRNGNILGSESIGGDLKGFTTGMLQADRLTWSTDSTTQREGITWQLLDRSEVDRDFLIIQGSQLDFNPNRIDGVNQIRLDAEVPVDGATTLTVKAVTRQDGKPFSGADASDFRVTINGATVEATGDDSANAGTYVFTVPALATNDEVVVSMHDSANNVSIITLDDTLYKSNSERVIAVTAV